MSRLLAVVLAVLLGVSAACTGADEQPEATSFNESGRIVVVVRDDEGKPVAPDSVRFAPEDPDTVVLDIGTQTDVRGRFVHDQLLPGEYSIEVEAAGFKPTSMPVRLAPHGDESVEVVLQRQ